MRALAQVALAFLRRDRLLIKPWAWGIEWLQMALLVVFWYFLTRLMSLGSPLAPGGSEAYFTFSLIGLALAQYVWRGFAALANRVTTEQASGALASLWVTQYPLPLLIALSSLWDFVAATVNAGLILFLGVYGFGASLRFQGIVAALGIGLLTAIGMSALGLLAGSWTIASGRGDGLRPLLNQLIPLVSGAFFPIALFPAWLQALAWCSPFTHALRLTRGLLMPIPMEGTASAWLALLGLTGVLALAGWWSLGLAIRYARLNGRLAAG